VPDIVVNVPKMIIRGGLDPFFQTAADLSVSEMYRLHSCRLHRITSLSSSICMTLTYIDMIAAPTQDFGINPSSPAHYAILGLMQSVMATNELLLLWFLVGAGAYAADSESRDPGGTLTMRSRNRAYQATRRLAQDDPYSMSFVTALAAAAVYEKRTDNPEGAKMHVKALLALLTADDLDGVKYPVLWRMTVVNKLIEIGVEEMYSRCDRFSDRVKTWRIRLEELQTHFSGLQIRTRHPKAFLALPALPQSAAIEGLNRPLLVRLYTLAHILHLWKHQPHAIMSFTDEIRSPSRTKPCVPQAPQLDKSSKDLPSFVLLQLNAHLVAEKLQLPIKARVNPADTLEFVELTMMLGPDSQNRICQAFRSWLSGDSDGSTWLDEGTLDELTLEILATRERDRRLVD
jgi:hypothetical protein